LLIAPAWAILRVNGNQLLSSSDSYSSSTTAKVFSPTAGRYVDAPAKLIFSFGQGVMGRGQLPHVDGSVEPVAVVIGLGLSYDIANVAYEVFTPCAVTLTGDINEDGVRTTQDVIRMVNWLFRSAPPPDPCVGAADVNCSGDITLSDLMDLISFVFKSGPAPCDVCSLPPGTWTCP
jgi:hypothetical protein